MILSLLMRGLMSTITAPPNTHDLRREKIILQRTVNKIDYKKLVT